MSVPKTERTPAPTPPPTDPTLVAHLEAIDGTVRDIFSAALAISSARSLTDGPAATRLDAALDHFDGIVRALRHLALACYAPDPQARVEAGSDHMATGTTEVTLMGQASSVLAGVDTTLTRLWADAVATDGHGSTARRSIADATRLVRQARLRLTTGVVG